MARDAFVPALRFAALTRFYDDVVAWTTRETVFRERLLTQVGICDGHAALDVGCGTGTFAIMLKRAAPLARVVGIDRDPAILELAVAKSVGAQADVRFELGSADALPYAADSFDRVVSSLVFHHLDEVNKRRAASEIFRVLKPGGEFHLCDWGPPSNPLLRATYGLVQLLDGYRNTQDNINGCLRAAITAVGFQLEAGGTLDTPLGTLHLLRARKLAA